MMALLRCRFGFFLMSSSFTDDEQATIVRVLGYPVEPSIIVRVSTECTRVEGLGAAYVRQARQILRDMARVEQDMRSSRPFIARTFQSNASGTTQMSPSIKITQPRDDFRMLAGQLASILGLPVARHIHGGGFGNSPLLRG